MQPIQTVLKIGGIDKKELRKVARPLSYVLGKYRVWKELKEMEECVTKT